MNERIREIIVKSGLYIAYDNREVTDKELEFFAELLIKECISCCVEIDDINKAYREGLFLDPEFGPKECINTIKTRFGIEE